MTAMTLPNLGLTTGFLTEEDGWGDDFNRNMRVVDALVQALVQDKDLTAPPGSPTGGQMWIVGASPTGAWSGQAGKLAVYVVGDDITAGWVFVAPKPGWKVWLLDESSDYRYSGSAWVIQTAGAGVTDGDKGDVTVSGSGTTWTIDNQAISYAKLQNVSAQYRLLGRNSASAGSPEEVSLSQLLDWVGSAANGDVLMRAGGVWTRLPVGSSGQVLTVASGVPSWATPSSGFGNPMTTAGDLILGGSAGAPGRLGAGTNGQVLTVVSGAPAWSTPSGGGGGLSNWTESVNTSSPNATVPVVRFLATNAATDVDAVVQAKGAGALLAQLPDSTTTGGNKRGSNSVDWQMSRTAATQVASAAYSTIAGGRNNRASSGNSFIGGGTTNIASNTNTVVGGGSTNTASGDTSTVAGGNSNTAAGAYASIGGGQSNATSVGDYPTIGGGDRNAASNYYATVGGGTQNIASGDSSTVPGGNNCTAAGAASTAYGAYALARTRGAAAHASGNFSSFGDAQFERMVHRRQTTSATPTALSANGSAPSSDTGAVLPNNSVYAFDITVVGKVTPLGDRASYRVTGQISRGANAAATQIDGTPTVSTLAAIGGASAWVCAVNANTTLGSLEITVTGAASTTIKWVASINATELVG